MLLWQPKALPRLSLEKCRQRWPVLLLRLRVIKPESESARARLETHTRSITNRRIERAANNPHIKQLVRIRQALDMLQMSKGKYAGESPLEQQHTLSTGIFTTERGLDLEIPLLVQFFQRGLGPGEGVLVGVVVEGFAGDLVVVEEEEGGEG
jgi:hypothetical protein